MTILIQLDSEEVFDSVNRAITCITLCIHRKSEMLDAQAHGSQPGDSDAAGRYADRDI